jgi:hypothetical protein
MHGNFKGLVARGLAVVRMDEDDWQAIGRTRLGTCRFSIVAPHEIATTAKADAPCLVVPKGGDEHQLYLGLVRSIGPAATLASRLVIDFVHPIQPGRLNALIDSVDEPRLKRAAAALKTGTAAVQAISDKLRQALLERIASFETNHPVLNLISAQLDRPKAYRDARALQQDALRLALKVFGADEDVSPQLLALRTEESSLGRLRLQEDTIIEHDARWIPGWHLSHSDLTGRAVFTRREEKLEVFTANKRPLEQLFGVDLIYFTVNHGAIVMVQYKMTEPVKPNYQKKLSIGFFDFNEPIEKEHTVKITRQFTDEISRMKKFDRDLSPDGPYRLNSCPFFFKFVRRNAAINSAGFMISLGHLEALMADGGSRGPRGGLRLNYEALSGSYLRSAAFVELIRSGYIGTRGATTDHLQALIDASLRGGRAVVAAMRSSLEGGSRG